MLIGSRSDACFVDLLCDSTASPGVLQHRQIGVGHQVMGRQHIRDGATGGIQTGKQQRTFGYSHNFAATPDSGGDHGELYRAANRSTVPRSRHTTVYWIAEPRIPAHCFCSRHGRCQSRWVDNARRLRVTRISRMRSHFSAPVWLMSAVECCFSQTASGGTLVLISPMARSHIRMAP